ncbi:hypothetical protein MTR_7g031230 [Medicago truncatula]|uniref:Putative plant transposon protein domain-containing protein n=1 Tax=Medicago truncatula TaxID=3880 RepID=G7L3B7_MEDTR|nr:hypothetical protein MTR_7g031230 [Medicago truncatula]
MASCSLETQKLECHFSMAEAWHLRINLRDPLLQGERGSKLKPHQLLDLMMSIDSLVRSIRIGTRNYAAGSFGMTSSSKFQLKGSIGVLLKSLRRENGRHWLPLTTKSTLKLCGRVINFDRRDINDYVGKQYKLNYPDELCPFHLQQNKGNWDHQVIQETILKPGTGYEKSVTGRSHVKKCNMTPIAQTICKIILFNIKPKSHLSTCTIDIPPLIYYILSDQPVDIARIIASELKDVNSITDAVIASHSDKEKKGKKSLGASSSPQPLIVIFPTWTPTSNSLHSGYPQEAAHQVPTPEAYESYCAWPGDRPFVHGGGGSSFMQVDEPVVMIRVMQTYMIRTKWQVRIQAKALQVMKSRTREE